MFLLDTLDNMPHLRVSDSLIKVFLWILKESGAQGVPSFKQLRGLQAKLRETSGTPSKLYKSAHGNLFYMNDLRETVANVSQGANSLYQVSLAFLVLGLCQPPCMTTYLHLP